MKLLFSIEKVFQEPLDKAICETQVTYTHEKPILEIGDKLLNSNGQPFVAS